MSYRVIPVLIIGAGPVGLQLALDLGWRGIECLVVDKAAGVPVVHPRAAGIAVRTMEFFRRWGIADKVLHGGFPLDFPMDIVYCTSLNGHLIERQQYPALGQQEMLDESPQKKHRLPQPFLDPLIAEAAASHPGVAIRYHQRLKDFVQGPEHVTATLVDERSGVGQEVHARYMVACDGVDSQVRAQLGIPYEGNAVLSYSVNAVFRIPEFARYHRMGDAERYLFIGESGTWANMTVVDGCTTWRCTMVGSEEKLDLRTLDMAGTIRRAIGRDDVPFEILAIAPWRRSEQVARQYRQGRVFLAGDSAHTMSPTGGMGMNTGAGDAVDLGWKLEAVLRGWGGLRLLDSYQVERRPVAIRNMKWSSGNFRTWLSAGDCKHIAEDSAQGEATRRRVGQTLKESLRVEWEQAGIQLGYRYDDSPICVPDGSPPTPDDTGTYIQTARPGARAPHAWLAPGRSTLDLFGRGFVLLRLGGDAPDAQPLVDAASRRGVPLRVAEVTDARIASLYERRLVLVRPDGHSAWRADELPADPLAVIDRVRGA